MVCRSFAVNMLPLSVILPQPDRKPINQTMAECNGTSLAFYAFDYGVCPCL